MTKVVALQNIPGLKAGKTGELTPQRQKHVDAGNARLLPGEHEAWGDALAEPAPEPVTIHTTSTTPVPQPVGDDVEADVFDDADGDADEDTQD